MPHHEENNFSAPPEVHDFAALLFDMDGTIIDSTEAIVRYWRQLGREIGVDGDYILETSHGRRSVDVLAIHAPHLANFDYVSKAEGQIPLDYGQSAVEIPGSRTMLDNLEKVGAPWAIVTSGTRPLVTGWLKVMKLAFPKNMVTAEDVQKGKPDPACYRLGAKRLGKSEVDPSKIVVFEDAPAGVQAGKAAGFRVVALATTHDTERLRDAGADWIVKDMRSVTLSSWHSKTSTTSIEIRNALVS
jgi:glycerol-1-phosphatase